MNYVMSDRIYKIYSISLQRVGENNAFIPLEIRLAKIRRVQW
jgi:hypothetical protein